MKRESAAERVGVRSVVKQERPLNRSRWLRYLMGLLDARKDLLRARVQPFE
jgi:hypothetical protein